jgi:hypothetical protein
MKITYWMTATLVGASSILGLVASPASASVPSAQPAANRYGGISWYWIQNPSCGYFDCYKMKVKASRTSCPGGLYVELNEYDRRGNIVDYTNAVVGSLRRGETAILTFNSTNPAAVSARLSEMSCY